MLCFPGSGELLISGDLHNHQRNFERLVKVAALDRFLDRHVVLQEIIHGGPLGKDGEDTSLDMLAASARWATEFPGRVHFLAANHDLAQVQRLAIMKDGYDLTDRFSRHLRLQFGRKAVSVEVAFRDFVYAMPLAAITVTGVFLSHSLPGPRELANFDPQVLRRPLTEQDYARNGPVYQLIWGRNQTQEVLNALSRLWWADLFICGHQQQDQGFGTIGDRMLILDSSHNHGSYLILDLSRPLTFGELVAQVRPLAEIG